MSELKTHVSTPAQQLEGNAAYFLDLIQEMELNPPKSLLDATYGSVKDGDLTIQEGIEAIQQLSKSACTQVENDDFYTEEEFQAKKDQAWLRRAIDWANENNRELVFTVVIK